MFGTAIRHMVMNGINANARTFGALKSIDENAMKTKIQPLLPDFLTSALPAQPDVAWN
jgi:hypothetical protein